MNLQTDVLMSRAQKIGDTVECHVDGEFKRVTWRDENTLVIEPDDARAIILKIIGGDLIHFVCGLPGETADDWYVKPNDTRDGFVWSSAQRGKSFE